MPHLWEGRDAGTAKPGECHTGCSCPLISGLISGIVPSQRSLFASFLYLPKAGPQVLMLVEVLCSRGT